MDLDISLKSGRKPMYWVNSIIALLLMFGFHYLPPMEPLTNTGMSVMGVFLGMVWGWIFVDMAWPSIVGLVALGMTEYCSVTQAFKDGFGNNTTLLVLFVMVYCGILYKGGIMTWLAQKIVSSPLTKGRPWVLSTCVMLSVMALCTVIGPAAATVLVWTMFYSICDTFGFKPGEKWPMYMLVGIPFCGSMAFSIFPFKSLPAAILGAYENVSGGATLPFFQFFIWQFICMIVTVTIFMLFLKYVIRPDIHKIVSANIAIDVVEGKLNNYQKMLLCYFVVFLFFMLAPSILPKAWLFTKIMKTVGTTATTIFFVVLLLAFKFESGPSLRELMGSKTVSWDLIFLLAGAMCIAGAMNSDQTGINLWFSSILQPFVEGKSGYLCMVLVLLAAAIMTNFCNNLATAAIFTPIAYNIALTSGSVSIEALILCLVGATNIAFLTPAGCAPAALVHGNKEWIPGINAVKIGFMVVAINFLVLILIGIPLANLMF